MKKALIIGLNNYPSCELHGCINDAKKVFNSLHKNLDGTINYDCKLITDESSIVRKGALKKEIESLFSGNCESVILYFSGHGFIDSTGGYIVTPDFSDGDEGIPMDTILTLANKSKCVNKTIILDCCHSGAFGSPALTNGNLSNISDGVTVLTASRDDEYALESGGSGLFTSLLVEGLNGSACDIMGNITIANIYSYIDTALGAWGQRPVFKTNVSRFAPIKQVTPLIDINVLRKICMYFKNCNDKYPLDPSYEFTTEVADSGHVSIFKDLQQLQSVGLVIPCDADYMYFAAINSKSCSLTTLGKRYWRLAKDNKI